MEKPPEDNIETTPEEIETTSEENNKNIIPRLLEDEMKQSYLDYAMSVIVSRALPNIKDGLKPVHRRILFAMNELGIVHGKPFKKSARIVGEVLGKYHPHGDSAVYDTLVRMAQEFSLRYPLINGQGNFGSIDGDSAAAMRYTEARMNKIGEEVLADIDKDTVDFVPNFDGTEKEPSVLPTKIPLLLINGSVGIAVGMATNIPPHNLTEVCNATIALIKNPDADVNELMTHIQGPDLPTGGLIFGTQGIELAYKTGRGKVKVRAKTHIEEVRGRTAIIVDEIPYQVNKADLVVDVANNVKNKVIEGISDIRDESDREGMRIVIELKRDASSEVVLNQLYKHTRFQTTIGMILLCLIDNIPRIIDVKTMLQHFIDHRKDVVTKRTQFDLTKAEKQAHILEGLKVAVENLDEAVNLIKKASNAQEAKTQLITRFNIDEIQSQAILDMKLQRLTGLERDKIIEEHKKILEIIKALQEILESDEKKFEIITEELQEIITKYGDDRRTEIFAGGDDGDLNIEDLIEPEDVAVTVTHSGYVKRVSLTEYKSQNRGGKGIIAAGRKDEDFVEKVFVANTHSYLLCFTNIGKVHWLKVYQIPEGTRQAKGKAIVNLLPLEEGEIVSTIMPIKEFKEGEYLILITKKGIVKKSLLQDYAKPRKGGVRGVVLDEGDVLIQALKTTGDNEIMIATANGIASRFSEKDLRPTGRVTRGSRGIYLREEDYVVGGILAQQGTTILTITENGFGKRTPIEDYRLIKRGGKGVINIQTSERNGNVVSVTSVTDEDEIMLISKSGVMIRTRANGISVIGRNTQGVRIMRINEEDKVVSATSIIE